MAHNMARHFEPEDVPQDAVLVLASTIRIHAPARYVFDILTQPATWSRWNTFMPSCQTVPVTEDGFLGRGTHMKAAVRMKKGASVRHEDLFVTCLEHESVMGQEVHRVAWRNDGYSNRTLRNLRTCEALSSVDGDECEFRSWEWMSGPLAHMVRMMYRKTLQARFEDMAADLKAYAEDTWVEQGWAEANAAKGNAVATTTEVSA